MVLGYQQDMALAAQHQQARPQHQGTAQVKGPHGFLAR
jgi:hypothetical protein